jgi:predicted Zn-dependent peptidase
MRKHPLRRGDTPPPVTAHIALRDKQSLEQAHFCMGVPAYPLGHERRYGAFLLNTLLGGGMSSRLFQKIREQQGLVYSVFSELIPYRDAGGMMICAGTSMASIPKLIDSVLKEFRDLKENLIPKEELKRTKDQLKGSLMLGLESTGSRMSNLARQEMYFQRFLTLDQMRAKIEAVTAEEVRSIAREFFKQENISVSVLGRLNGLRVTRSMLAC